MQWTWGEAEVEELESETYYHLAADLAEVWKQARSR
jgi:hypothetical protein